MDALPSATAAESPRPRLSSPLDAELLECDEMDVVLKSSVSASGLLDAEAGPKVSLWDLRADVKGALAATSDASTVELPRATVVRMLEVMREHVGHRQVERALRKDAKVRAGVIGYDTSPPCERHAPGVVGVAAHRPAFAITSRACLTPDAGRLEP
jgi:hypothetical protein